MKLSFPDRFSVGVSTRKQVESSIRWLIVIGFLVGVGGSYLLGNHFVSLAIIVLGIGGILVGGATVTLLNWRRVDGTHSAASKKKVRLRITSEWHYRPKAAMRAYAAVDSAGAETSEDLIPEHFAINNNGWFKDGSLEYAPHTFVSVDARVGTVTAKAPLSAHQRAVSGYD
jgi:hypothetical protein